MALKEQELNILIDIVRKVASQNLSNFDFKLTAYPISTIINGTEKEKLEIIKAYLTDIKLPEAEASALGFDEAKKDADAKIIEYTNLISTLPV